MQGDYEVIECVINGRRMTAHPRDGYYIGVGENGEYHRLTEEQVIEGVQVKMAADVEAYNQHAPQAAVSRGSYYGD